MPSLVVLDQWVATYEEKRGDPTYLANLGNNAPKQEKWACLLRRRRV